MAEDRKAAARALVREFLLAQPRERVEWLIRVNATDSPHFNADLEAAVAAGPDAIVIPKVWRPETLQWAENRLTEAERAAARPLGDIRLFAMIDCVYLNMRNEEGLQSEAAQAAALGFAGKQAIHPGQLPLIHEAFTPTPRRVERAKRILAVWDQAQAEGKGVVALDGELIELPIVALERRVLERAG